jgi:isoleucyl-tRNA synthetase
VVLDIAAHEKLTRLVPKLEQWLIVSEVDLQVGPAQVIIVSKAQGMTCPRCWNVTHDHQEDGLCTRCQSVVNAL